MLKTYTVVFQDEETGRVGIDTFNHDSEADARKTFKARQRRCSKFRILAVVEVPKIEKQEEVRR